MHAPQLQIPNAQTQTRSSSNLHKRLSDPIDTDTSARALIRAQLLSIQSNRPPNKDGTLAPIPEQVLHTYVRKDVWSKIQKKFPDLDENKFRDLFTEVVSLPRDFGKP